MDPFPASSKSLRMNSEPQTAQRLNRREFLKGSASLTAALALPGSVFGAAASKAAAQAETGLFLAPHLSCPTETSIRVSALSESQPVHAVIEVRQKERSEWERREREVSAGAYSVLDWTIQNLSPANQYEYRVL